MSDSIRREPVSEAVSGIAVVNFDVTTPHYPEQDASQSEAGKSIARRYVLGDRLGRGGQAEVYHALDTALKRPVALKLYYPTRHRADESAPSQSNPSVPAALSGSSPEGIDVELDPQTFQALDDLLAGRRHDLWEVAATLGVSRAEVNRSLVRGVSLTGRFASLRPLAASLGLEARELLAAAAAQGEGAHSKLAAEIVRETWDGWPQQNSEGERRAELEQLARADSHRVRQEAALNVPEAPAEFLRELQFLREFSFPGVISVLDWGCEGDRAFMVLPLCTSDLHCEKKSRGRLPPDEAVSHVRSAALILHRLHDIGVLHCDVKPHNFLLRDGELFLSDFGLARGRANWEPEGMQGTPGYMSPEQLCVQQLDPRTDIYSLGVMLYELLTGQLPFEVTRLARDELEALRLRVLFEPPPPLTARVPDLPSALEKLCLKAMAKEPEDRFQSAAELAAALGRWNTSGPARLLLRVGNWFRRKSNPAPAAKPDVSAAIEQNSLSLRESIAAGRREGEGEAHVNLAAALSLVADWEGAIGHYQQALTVYGELGDASAEADTRWALSQTLHKGGSREQAIEQARKAAELYTALGSPMSKLISSQTASW